MQDLGKGIGTVGIWIGVGICGAFHVHGIALVFIALFAALATGDIWKSER